MGSCVITGTKELFKGHAHPQPPNKSYLLARGVVAHPFNALARGPRPHVGHWGPFLPAAAMVLVTVVVCGCSMAGAQTTLVQSNPSILGISRKLSLRARQFLHCTDTEI
jgi:hypothetical protein